MVLACEEEPALEHPALELPNSEEDDPGAALEPIAGY